MVVDVAMKRSNSLVKRHINDTESNELRARLTEPSSDDAQKDASALPQMAGKRKQPEYKPGRFKAVSQLVVAMNRFKASLNPTYTFGKRTDSGSILRAGKDSSQASSQEADTLTSAPSEGLDSTTKVYSNRGHKTNYLLRPLPPVAGEVQAQS